MIRRKLSPVALIVAVVLVAWWWRRPASVPSPPTGALDASIQERPEEPAPPAAEAPGALEPAPAPLAEVLEPGPAPAAPRVPPWTLRGRIDDPVTGGGLPDATVEFALDGAPPRSGAAARADAAGLFSVVFDDPAWRLGALAHCWVRDADGAPRFSGLVRLEQDFAVAIEPVCALRGVVDCSYPWQGSALHVAVFELPARAREQPRPIGAAETDALGAFEVRGVRFENDAWALVQVTLRGEGGLIAQRGQFVTFADLLSDSGARVALDVTRARVFVRDERGDGIEGASVHWADPGRASREVEREARTDAEGWVEFTVGSGLVELDVGAPGHETSWGSFEAAGALVGHEVLLRELAPGEELFGSALLPGGAPAEGALVTVRAQQLDTQALPAGAARAEANGMFRVAVAKGRTYDVHGEHELHGRAGPVPAALDGRALVLTLQRPCKLRVELQCDGLPPAFASGELDYVLVGEGNELLGEGERVVRGTAASAPFEVTGLAPWRWQVFVVAKGLGACARGEITLLGRDGSSAAADDATLLLALDRAHWVDALVRDESGAPLANVWATARGIWPAQASDILGLARVQPDGRLRAFCDSRDVLLEIHREEGATPLTARLRADEFAELIVR